MHRHTLKAITLAAASLFSGTALACQHGDNSLLIMGDSLSAGYIPRGQTGILELRQDLSYGAILGSSYSYSVTNTAVGGHTATWVRDSQAVWARLRLPGQPATYTGYKKIVVMVGGNDAISGINAATIADTLLNPTSGLLSHVKTTPFCSPSLLVVAPPHYSASTAAIQQDIFSQLQARVAVLKPQGYRVAALDLYTRSQQMNYNCYAGDGHPCAAAHVDIAQQIHQAFSTLF